MRLFGEALLDTFSYERWSMRCCMLAIDCFYGGPFQ